MEFKAFILLPAKMEEDKTMFERTTFGIEMPEDTQDQWSLDIIEINCSSPATMIDAVDNYFKKVIKRPATEDNIAGAAYLGLIHAFLQNNLCYDIPDNFLETIRKIPKYSNIQSNSGFCCAFEAKQLNIAFKTAKETIGRI